MPRKLQLESSTLLEKTVNAKTRFVVHEGGARSSKTYSILQYLIGDAIRRNGQGIEYDIVRATMPALRASAMKDFFDILKVNKLYRESAHNMTENTYKLRGNTFNFYSTSSSKEDEQKIRGRKRNIIFLNEANEIPYETFEQVNLRTTEQIILDYNPSQEEHWIYDKVIPQPNCTFIHSTYLDNPFLETSITEAIESYKGDDEDTWKVFGLGLRGKRTGLIYQNWDIVPDWPTNCDDILYGFDFGFNDPKVVVRLGKLGNDIYIDELFYKSGVPREDFIPILKQLIPYEQRTKEQYADSADPESIEVIYRAGFNIHPADKSPDSVLFGIETVKGYRLHITARSVNVQKDFKNYKWKVDKNGKTLDEPTHAFSHSPDAVRYPVYTHWGKAYRNLTEENMKEVAIEEMESVNVFRRF